MTTGHGSPANHAVPLVAGTRYLCQRCTACCRWPGDVRVDSDDITRIAAFLGMDEAECIDRHTRLRANRQGLSLLERDDHTCGMLEGDACRIHPAKPAQCVGFPDTWNFPGWRDICRAVPVRVADGTDPPPS